MNPGTVELVPVGGIADRGIVIVPVPVVGTFAGSILLEEVMMISGFVFIGHVPPPGTVTPPVAG